MVVTKKLQYSNDKPHDKGQKNNQQKKDMSRKDIIAEQTPQQHMLWGERMCAIVTLKSPGSTNYRNGCAPDCCG
jgi:hypothetical protein